MKKKKLIIVGGQGSGVMAMSVFQDINAVTNEWDIEGYLNDIRNPGEMLGNHKVLGPTEAVVDYVKRGYYIHYTLIYNAKQKEQRVKKLKEMNIPEEAHATGIHPLAYVNPTSKVGYGVLMMAFASTSVEVNIGNMVHVYGRGYMAHNAVIGDYSTITAGSIVGARVKLGEGVHVGLNATIKEDLKIGKYSLIGMAANVLKDVGERKKIVGNPGRELDTPLIKKIYHHHETIHMGNG
ncbi:MAG: hypothetical protein MI922_00975 [Bacteroidales bacterium]|nr:hypothetical protein [Bacteroidales bacterium]